MIHKLNVPKKLEHKLRSIPPWIFRHTVDLVEDGTLVLLVDSKNKGLVFGLADSGDISIRVLGRSPRQIRGILEQRIQQAHQLRTRFGPRKQIAFD